ncbi:hypothetical protein SDRG_11356 [Saprolegnia diclina VS20]|uniref:PH domain-containing protein n=1 Tax=Saprolegnia diclina (strain VS20) TaxID=1156394 RepID=T0QBG8_SAPDV|nr:hypothetical protein SDRG_11356 [Saprolegnia diclina VS20]EQC30875.1 hypothetical protein SDRG_11356 [Saprolegnia diclina VS20]|eukprot:XP_008615613.1 hypothetical protein SDRG_11356 [Saprolegnia diclina VS20]
MEGYLLVFDDPYSITKAANIRYLVLTEGTLSLYTPPPSKAHVRSISLSQRRLQLVAMPHLHLFRLTMDGDAAPLLCLASSKAFMDLWCLHLQNWNRFCFHTPVACGVDDAERDKLRDAWTNHLLCEEKSFVRDQLRGGVAPKPSFLQRLRSPAAWL